MKIILCLILSNIVFANPDCVDCTTKNGTNLNIGNDLVGHQIIKNILECSEEMTEAIYYRVKDTQKGGVYKVLSSLCIHKENKFIPTCIIMAKDGGVKNTTIAKVCNGANELSPICILTAVAKKYSDKEIIHTCTNPTKESLTKAFK